MSLPKEQLQMIGLNLPGVQILNADIFNEREVTIQATCREAFSNAMSQEKSKA